MNKTQVNVTWTKRANSSYLLLFTTSYSTLLCQGK